MKIGVLDIGGTAVKSGLWDGSILRECRETKTPEHARKEEVLACVVELLHGFGTMDAIGVSATGQVDCDRGVIRDAIFLKELVGLELREPLERMFGVPVAVDNDVNMAARGEAVFGAGRDQTDFLCLTYGTGIGGAIVIDRQVWHGSLGVAAEFGAVITHGGDCRVAKEAGSAVFPAGTYEEYASTTALVRRAAALDPTLVDGRAVFARRRETGIREIVDQWIDEILLGLSGLIHIFNPPCIVLGGGVMEQSWLPEEIRGRIGDYVMPVFREVQIRAAECGNRAGLLGAASAAMELYEQRAADAGRDERHVL